VLDPVLISVMLDVGDDKLVPSETYEKELETDFISALEEVREEGL